MSFKLLSSLFATAFLYGCSSPHLEIFPGLENPQLIKAKIAPEKLKEDINESTLKSLNANNMTT